MKKKCFKCLRMLPLSEFYPHKQMGDGHLNKCRDCARNDSEQRRIKKMKDPKWAEKENQRMRDKANKVNYEYPEVATARRAVRKLGRSREFHWHHWSYLKQHHLDVIKLAPEKHRLAHRHMVYDRERMQYRRSDSMILLDTKEIHNNFIESL